MPKLENIRILIVTRLDLIYKILRVEHILQHKNDLLKLISFFAANIGAIHNLTIGISAISICEIFYYFV